MYRLKNEANTTSRNKYSHWNLELSEYDSLNVRNSNLLQVGQRRDGKYERG